MDLLKAYRKKNNLSYGIYYPTNEHQVASFEPPGSSKYYEMMRGRADVYLSLIHRFRLSFIFMDADIIFSKDPLTDLFLNEDRGEPEDVIYSTDARNFYSELQDPFEGQPFTPKICGGFFLMRSTEPTTRLLKDLSAATRADLNANDQWTIDRLLNSHYNQTNNAFVTSSNRTWLVEPFPSGLMRRNTSVRTKTSLKLRLLEQAAYINGHIYGSLHDQYWNQVLKTEKRNWFFQRIMVHANTWVENKLELMKRNSLWLLGPDDVCIL